MWRKSLSLPLLTGAILAGTFAPAVATQPIAPHKTTNASTQASEVNAQFQPKLLIRNTTAQTIMIYTTPNGNPQSHDEYHQATLAPGREVNLSGGWNAGFDSAYARVYSTKAEAGGLARDKMVAWVANSNERLSAGSNNSERLHHTFIQNETHDNWGISGSNFNAWTHRDENFIQDRRVVIQLKVTIKSLDSTPTRDKCVYEPGTGVSLTNKTDKNLEFYETELDGKTKRGEGAVLAPGSSVSVKGFRESDPKDVIAILVYPTGERVRVVTNNVTIAKMETRALGFQDFDSYQSPDLQNYDEGDSRERSLNGHKFDTKRLNDSERGRLWFDIAAR